MFRFFRRRERSSLTLFEPGPQSVVVAEGADAPVAAEGTEVEPATGEPEPEKLAVNESALVDPPQAPPEPEGAVAKSTPPTFAPADPAVPNLYSVRNAGVKFAIQDTTSYEPVVKEDKDFQTSLVETLAEAQIASEENVTVEETVANSDEIAVSGASTSQSAGDRASAEPDDNLESSAAEKLHARADVAEEANATEAPGAIEAPVVSEGSFTAASSEESAPTELDANLETSATQSSVEGLTAVAEEQASGAAASVIAEEVSATEELVADDETRTEPLETSAAAANDAVIVPSEVTADEQLAVETTDSLLPTGSEAADASNGPHTVDAAASADFVSESPVSQSLPEKAGTTSAKSKRRWWTFWRRRQPVEEPVAESPAHESPAAHVGNDGLTEKASGVESQAAIEQLPAAEAENADQPSDETLAVEAPTAEEEAAAAESVAEKDFADLATSAPSAIPEVASSAAEESDAIAESVASEDVVAAKEPAGVEEIADTEPDAPDAAHSEVHANELLAADNIAEVSLIRLDVPETAEHVAASDLVTIEGTTALEKPPVDAEASDTRQMPLLPDSILLDPVANEATQETQTQGMSAAEMADAHPLETASSIEAAVTDPSALEPETCIEADSPEAPAVEDDTSAGQQDAPEIEIAAVVEEGVPANVSDARVKPESRRSAGASSGKPPGGHGIFDLPRVPELEVMDDAEEVDAYASAAAQAWLDKIDDSFVEHAINLVKGRPRGRALDVGTGPGQIALKLARRLSLWKIVGIDRSQRMIDEARARLADTASVTGRLEFRVADGNRLDFPNATFDLVICNSVLHHFADPKNLLAEIARVTKPRGAILLRDLRRPSRVQYAFHVRWHGRHYEGKMGQLYRDSVRAAYTVPELQKLLDASRIRGARVFRYGSTHIGIERPHTS